MTNWAHHYYYHQLSPSDQFIYDTFVSHWRKFEPVVTFDESIKHDRSFYEIAKYVIGDHVDMFWIDYNRIHVDYQQYKVVTTVPLYFNREESLMYIRRLRAWRHNIVAGIDQSLLNDEKIYLLFDYFERRTTYGREDRKFSQTVVGPCRIDNEVSVCEGIAKSIKYVCDLMDVPCIVVSGQANFGPNNQGAHAWNIVESNKGCRHMDGVRYLTESKVYGHLRSHYLFTDAQVKAPQLHNHQPLYRWDETITPRCE